MKKWKIVVVGDTTYEAVEAKTAEDALKKANIEVPKGWTVQQVGNTLVVSPPIKLG